MDKKKLKSKKPLIILLFFGLSLIFFFLAIPYSSATDFGGSISEEDQDTFDQILEPILKIYNLIKYIITAIASLVLLLAGASYIVSGSDPKKRENAKSTAMYVIIGLVIIWAAPLVVNFILT